MNPRISAAVVVIITAAIAPLAACAKDLPDCATVAFTGKETIQGMDKATGERTVLYPVVIRFNGFGAPTGYTDAEGEFVRFQGSMPDGIRMFLPAGSYTFSGPWPNGTCNPRFVIRE